MRVTIETRMHLVLQQHDELRSYFSSLPNGLQKAVEETMNVRIPISIYELFRFMNMTISRDVLLKKHPIEELLKLFEENQRTIDDEIVVVSSSTELFFYNGVDTFSKQEAFNYQIAVFKAHCHFIETTLNSCKLKFA